MYIKPSYPRKAGTVMKRLLQDLRFTVDGEGHFISPYCTFHAPHLLEGMEPGLYFSWPPTRLGDAEKIPDVSKLWDAEEMLIKTAILWESEIGLARLFRSRDGYVWGNEAFVHAAEFFGQGAAPVVYTLRGGYPEIIVAKRADVPVGAFAVMSPQVDPLLRLRGVICRKEV